jgi:hypothetical protein
MLGLSIAGKLRWTLANRSVGARLRAKRQPQQVEDAATDVRHSRARSIQDTTRANSTVEAIAIQVQSGGDFTSQTIH